MSTGPESDYQLLHEFIAKARINLDQNNWDYLIGGSETETAVKRNRLAIAGEFDGFDRQTFGVHFLFGQLCQSISRPRLVEGQLSLSLGGIYQDELPFALRQIEAIPELVGLAAGIGEPVRLDLVAENQGALVGVRLLGAGPGKGGKDKCDKDGLLTEQ